MTKTIPKKNKCKKAKWLSQEVLQIAEGKREAKGREKEKQKAGRKIKIYPTECRVTKNSQKR